MLVYIANKDGLRPSAIENPILFCTIGIVSNDTSASTAINLLFSLPDLYLFGCIRIVTEYAKLPGAGLCIFKFLLVMPLYAGANTNH